MRKKVMRLTALVLAAAMMTGGCGTKSSSMTAGLKPERRAETDKGDFSEQVKGGEKEAVVDFSVRLLQQCGREGQNVLISPVSILCALGMAEAGARGDTLAQMEALFGADSREMNRFLGDYTGLLPSGEDYRFHMADAIWFNKSKSLAVEEAYLQAVVDYYNAQIYEAPFGDRTKDEINGWVKKNTDGMIPTILDRMDENGVVDLVNAVSFDAKWETTYDSYQVADGTFTAEDGRVQNTEMMHSTESHYIEGDNETGFMKYYKGDHGENTYAFVALLPEAGLSMADYLASLSGGELSELLENEQFVSVMAMLPKFKAEYQAHMAEVLTDMGMTDAFDADRADFSGMGTCPDGNIYISDVIHKTLLSVDEEGTKAAAATVVEMASGSAFEEEWKEVFLDRPFVYMIVDCEHRIPLFLGVENSVDGTPVQAVQKDGRTGEEGKPQTAGRTGEEGQPQTAGRTGEEGQPQAWKRMVMLAGNLYVETGETDSALRCGMMDGTITSTTDGEPPTKNNQSNFGKDIGFQYGGRENRIEIYLDDAWRIFAYNENNIEGLEVSVSNADPRGCTVTFRNNCGRELTFGEQFQLEKEASAAGEWTFVPIVLDGEYGFNCIGYPVADGQSRDWDVDWTWLYGELEPGRYRIVKNLTDSTGSKGYTPYTISREFSVK